MTSTIIPPQIMAYIHDVAAANPTIAFILDLTTSSEGLPVHGLKISTGPGKKAIYIECGVHAREWTSPTACLKTIEEVIASAELQDLVDWYILPVVNPDGYTYTWTDVSKSN